ARAAARGCRGARGGQRHLVYVARAGARYPGLGLRARADLVDAPALSGRARVSVRPRAAPPGTAVELARRRGDAGDAADARCDRRPGDRDDREMGCRRVEYARVPRLPRLLEDSAGPP